MVFPRRFSRRVFSSRDARNLDAAFFFSFNFELIAPCLIGCPPSPLALPLPLLDEFPVKRDGLPVAICAVVTH